MDEELQTLRAQMEDLRKNYERLSQAPRGDVGGQSSGSSGGETDPLRREQAFYLPRERKCPKFSGARGMGSLLVEDWVEEARTCIRTRGMSNLDKAMFLYDHLEGEARNEIKYRPKVTKEDPEKIIKVLIEVYGCTKSYVYWQQKFFDRKQREGESLYEFSHALMELMEKVKSCNNPSITNPDIVIRDQFCENVRDSTLRRELKRLVRGDDQLTLLDVRSEAIRWVEEGQPNRDKHARTTPLVSEAQIASQCDSVQIKPSSEFSELKEIILRQQAQLDLLMARLGPQPDHSRRPPPPTFRGTRFKRAPDGQPICIQCNLPGHIARYCPTQARDPSIPSVPSNAVSEPSANSSGN